MRRYFTHRIESLLGIGKAYFEIEALSAVRQVEEYDEKMFSSRELYHDIGPALSDKPFTIEELGQMTEITREDFEEMWRRSAGKRD